MKKKIVVVVIFILTILTVAYLSYNNLGKYNTSVEKKEMISFFEDNENLFIGIKEKLDTLSLEYIEINIANKDIIFRGYYEKDKDNILEIDDDSLKILCKDFFSKVKERNLPTPTIKYRNKARSYVGTDGMDVKFSYATNKKSAVETGIMFIGDNENYIQARSDGFFQEIQNRWFYYFIGLV